jgi:hypothetical protein
VRRAINQLRSIQSGPYEEVVGIHILEIHHGKNGSVGNAAGGTTYGLAPYMPAMRKMSTPVGQNCGSVIEPGIPPSVY